MQKTRTKKKRTTSSSGRRNWWHAGNTNDAVETDKRSTIRCVRASLVMQVIFKKSPFKLFSSVCQLFTTGNILFTILVIGPFFFDKDQSQFLHVFKLSVYDIYQIIR
jgi:hypothetical protein